jgi:hypothetical protein
MPYNLAGFEPGSYVPEADAMSTAVGLILLLRRNGFYERAQLERPTIK